MAALTVTNPTLLDLAKAMDPDGNIANVVELLSQENEILQDMTWMEGNLTTGHQSSVRTGLASGTWRKMYGFVQPTKNTNAIITDTTGVLHAYGVIDKDLADLNGNTAAFRMQEESGTREGLNQAMAQALIYANEAVDPEQITGLSPRFNDLAAANADNIIDAGGTGTDNGSIWLCVWGPQTGFGIVPKGDVGGLKITDKGVVTDVDAVGSTGGLREVYRTHYRWAAGLVVRDWRYFVRIANIDKSLLSSIYTAGAFATGAHLPNLILEAMNLVPNMRMGRPSLYMSRDMLTALQQQLAAAVQASSLTVDNVGGVITFGFKGIPIRRVDVMAADEARVV